MAQIKFGLCEGRHPMPVDTYIFGNSISDVKDIKGMNRQAEVCFVETMRAQGIDMQRVSMCLADAYEDSVVWRYKAECRIYASGLTVALLAAVNMAKVMFTDVVVMHYDVATGEYYPQEII